MTTFFYVKTKEPVAGPCYLHFDYRTGVGLAYKPTLFLSKSDAFAYYEDYRSNTKMAGNMPTTLMEIKEIEL